MTPLAVASLLLLSSSDPVGDAFRTWVDRGATPGLAWELVRDGRVVRQGEYGYADLENRVKVNRDSVFEIGSMTKQFTASVVVLLAKEGKLSLDDPIGKYVPDLPETWRPLVIRRLLSHTSGLKDYLGSFPLTDSRYFAPSEVTEKIGKAKLDFEPGTAWAYSNTGYFAISMMIERIEGKALAKVFEERLFKPLGMSHTGSSAPDTVMPHRVRGYIRGAKGWQNAPAINPFLASGAGLLVSTLGDLAKWQLALQSGRIPTNDLWQPVTMKDGSLWNYGLGWMIEPINGKTIVHHGGNTAGQSSDILVMPSRHEALIVFTNGNGLNPGDVSRYAAGLIDPSLAMEHRTKADPNFRQTLELALMLRKWGRQDRDTSLFAPPIKDMLGTLRGIGMRQSIEGLGKAMKRLDYVDEESFGPDRWVRYRVEVGKVTGYLVFRWNPQGQIVQLDQVYAH